MDLEPGIYKATIRFGGKLSRRWIRIEKGKKATLSVAAKDMTPGGVDTAPGISELGLVILVADIKKAAKDCDANTYNRGKLELEAVVKELKIELEELEQLVKEEAERTRLPDDAAKLKDMLGTPAGTDEAKAPRDPAATKDLQEFEPLVRQRDEVKARLKTVEAELASLPPLQPCPPKAVETPAPKPGEKPPAKPSDNKEGR